MDEFSLRRLSDAIESYDSLISSMEALKNFSSNPFENPDSVINRLKAERAKLKDRYDRLYELMCEEADAIVEACILANE